MTHRSPWIAGTTLGALALLLSWTAAHAAEASDSNAWRVQITPYVWMPSLKGTMKSPNLQDSKVSQSFSDSWDDLNAAAFLNGTARKGHYVIQADASYASISETTSLPYGLKGDLSVKQTSLTLTGGYNWTITPKNSLDLMFGFRWWQLKGSMTVQPLGSARLNQSFADPVIAARWRYEFNDRWSTLLYADYGKFSGGSESTYQGLAVLNYQIKQNIFVSAGYRVLDVDYQKHGKRLDVRLGGPILGATFKF